MKILYFGASHCGQCKVLKPNFIKECQRLGLEEAKDYELIDAEENMELSDKYDIRNLPTVVFVNGSGEVTHRAVGVNAWKDIEENVKNRFV